MQFIPSSWRAYGVDANKDGKKDPYNPVDAIFAAARYLKAAGYEDDVRRAIFAYNHADWYVDSVLLRARLIAGVPGRPRRLADRADRGPLPRRRPRALRRRPRRGRGDASASSRGENAANVIESNDDRRSIDIFAKTGAPVVATNDGVIKKIGEHRASSAATSSSRTSTATATRYADLGSVAKYYPVPKDEAGDAEDAARRRSRPTTRRPPKPTRPPRPAASPTTDTEAEREGAARASPPTPSRARGVDPGQGAPVRPPGHARARSEPAASSRCSTPRHAQAAASRPTRTTSRAPSALDAKDVRLKRLKKGSQRDRRHGPRPRRQPDAGKAPAPRLRDPPGRQAARRGSTRSRSSTAGSCSRRPRSTAPRARTSSTARTATAFSIGQILLLPKPLLEKRVLSDERIEIYPCGRTDIRTGQIDRRVLATLEYLAESGLRPTVSSLKCGHGFSRPRATSRITRRATRSTSPRSTACRSSATRSPAGSPSRPCGG